MTNNLEQDDNNSYVKTFVNAEVKKCPYKYQIRFRIICKIYPNY